MENQKGKSRPGGTKYPGESVLVAPAGRFEPGVPTGVPLLVGGIAPTREGWGSVGVVRLGDRP